MIAITIDCEQWNSPLLRGKKVKENNNTEWSKEGNKILFDILEKRNIKATFFVTGFFAQEEKEQTREISKNYEVACHGYNHFYRKNPKLNLEKDIKKAKKILESVTKRKIIGFRAPQMQFSYKLLNILKKEGFKYDSSLHPAFLPGSYIHINKPLKPFFWNGVKEIPTAVMPFCRLPINWLFMRNLGEKWTEIAIKLLLRKKITPVLYFHSWEFVEIKSEAVPFYITKNTGKKFCMQFQRLLKKFKNEKFVEMNEFMNIK